jgi:acetyltransferase-like isoleucine patch superfamily enzyme
MSFLSPSELTSAGFAALGENVLVSSKASIHGAERISLGSHVRIDDFCVLSAGAGGIAIGSHIHIAVFCSLIGAETITIEDFANLSSRVSVYSSSDDYSGRTMTNPMVPDRWKAVESLPVRIGRHVIVGAGSVILPGVVLGDGVAVGALSLVNQDCQPFGVYAGVPARRHGERDQALLDLERQFTKGNSPEISP